MAVFPVKSKSNKAKGEVLDAFDTSITNIKVVAKDKHDNLVNIDLEDLQTFLNPSSLFAFSTSVPADNLLGRYDNLEGGVQLITLGNMFSLENNMLSLNANLSALDISNSVLTGKYPKYKLKRNLIGTDELSNITSDKLLGRSDDYNLQPQEINIGADFTLDTNTNTLELTNTTSFYSSGWIFEEKTDSFIAEMNHIYYIRDSKGVIYVECDKEYTLGNQFKIINSSSHNVVIVFKHYAKEMSLLDGTRVAHFVCGPVGHKFQNVSFTTIRDITIGSFGNVDQLTDEYQLNNTGKRPYTLI